MARGRLAAIASRLKQSRPLRTAARLVRAVRIASTDRRIPRPLRVVAALGLLPIPGPFDEIVLVAVALPLWLFYRRPLADAWRRAGDGSSTAP